MKTKVLSQDASRARLFLEFISDCNKKNICALKKRFKVNFFFYFVII